MSEDVAPYKAAPSTAATAASSSTSAPAATAAWRFVGKRVHAYYFFSSRRTLASRVVLVMSNGSRIVLEASHGLRLAHEPANAADPQALLNDPNFVLVDSAVVPQRHNDDEVTEIFLTLWDKAIAVDTYVKKEWMRLASFLGEVGLAV